jgi:ribosomal protein L40E
VSSGPELFVVCKKCNSEVSPYITECPYCGTRLRKRAPKLEKGGVPKASRRRMRAPTL